MQGGDSSSLDPNDSTTWPTKVTLAGRFTDTSGTNNTSFGETKLDGREFTVSSVARDTNGYKYLLLSTTDTDTVNITDKDIQVFHTESTDVEAFFEGGTNVFDGSTSHFGSNKIVLREIFKHSYKNTDVINESRGFKGGAVSEVTSSTSYTGDLTVAVDGTSYSLTSLSVSGATNDLVASSLETAINAAIVSADATKTDQVTVEWTGTEYRVMSNSGTSTSAVAISSPTSTLANLNLTGTNNWIGNDSTLSADVTSGTVSKGNSYVAGTTGNTFTITVDGTTSGTVTLPAATYDTNADVATALQTAINADATLFGAGESVSVVWTGSAYAITSSTGAITALTIDSVLDSHLKLSANYGAGNSSGGAATTGYGGVFSNFKSSLSAGDLNDI